MTPQDFQQIKQKIDAAKEKKARAEGALSKIEEQWKRDYKITTLEEAEEKIKSLESEIEKDKTKLESMYEKLEAVTDWDSSLS